MAGRVSAGAGLQTGALSWQERRFQWRERRLSRHRSTALASGLELTKQHRHHRIVP